MPLTLLPLHDTSLPITTEFSQHDFGASATVLLFAFLFLLSSMCGTLAPSEGGGELMSLIEQLRMENECLERGNLE